VAFNIGPTNRWSVWIEEPLLAISIRRARSKTSGRSRYGGKRDEQLTVWVVALFSSRVCQ
jgi:hypothetical protein